MPAGATTKKITEYLRKKNWLLQISDKGEMVLWTDFWHEVPNQGKRLTAIWDAIEQNQRIEVLVPSSSPDQFAKLLPPDFENRTYPNVLLVAVLGDSPDENAQRIVALQKTPVSSRGLWVNESHDPSEIGNKPPGIHFVIVCRSTGGDERASFTGSVQCWQEWCAGNGLALVLIPPISHEASPSVAPSSLPFPFPTFLPIGEGQQRELNVAARSRNPVEESSASYNADNSSDSVRPQLVSRKTARRTGRTRHSHRPSGKRAEGAGAVASDAVVACDVTVVDVVEDIASDGRQCPTDLVQDGQETTLERFRRLDSVVRTGLRAGIEAGFALKEIRDSKLWREGPFVSWNAYCENILETSRSHINRLIRHATDSRELLENSPPIGEDGKPILPAGESLIRPLKKIKCARTRATAWRQAVEDAGGMPTARIVEEVVANFVERKTDVTKPTPLPVKRRELVRKLRAAAEDREDWDSILTLVSELEKLS